MKMEEMSINMFHWGVIDLFQGRNHQWGIIWKLKIVLISIRNSKWNFLIAKIQNWIQLKHLDRRPFSSILKMTLIHQNIHREDFLQNFNLLKSHIPQHLKIWESISHHLFAATIAPLVSCNPKNNKKRKKHETKISKVTKNTKTEYSHLAVATKEVLMKNKLSTQQNYLKKLFKIKPQKNKRKILTWKNSTWWKNLFIRFRPNFNLKMKRYRN